jgi:hypothetical protein
VSRSAEEARLYDHRADAERRYLRCQRFNPAFEAELRGRVCGAEFLTDDAAGRGDRDDQAGALLTHDGQHSPGDVQRAEKIRLDLCPEVTGADLLEESRDEVARIVDQNVNPDQAVYAYAREDLDWWERELGYKLPAGQFGETRRPTAWTSRARWWGNAGGSAAPWCCRRPRRASRA